MITFCRFLISTAALLLGMGLTAPTMKLVPRMGNFTEWVALAFPQEMTTKSYSIIAGIDLMRQSGSIALALIIFTFSVIFPIVKLICLWYTSLLLEAQKNTSGALRMIEKAGKFSMVDVFVIAVFIATVKALPGGSQLLPQWGLYIFFASVLCSMIAGITLSSLQKKTLASAKEESSLC